MLEAYAVSQSPIRSLRAGVPIVKKNDRDLADQPKRAATSVSLNLAEGEYRVADPIDDGEARTHLERVQGMLWGLVHGPKLLRQQRD